MKIKRISKSSVKIFLVSFFLTLFFMASLGAFVLAEKNSLKTGVREIETSLALYTSEKSIRLVVNDREHNFSLEPIQNAVKSRKFGALLMAFLCL